MIRYRPLFNGRNVKLKNKNDMNAKKFYLDTYGEQRDYTFSAQDMVDFAEAYAKQQVVEKDKWISIEDSLPEKGEVVLVWAKEVAGDIYYYVDEPSCVKVVFSNIGHSLVVDCDYYSVYVSGITHWQPLPKAPKK